MIKRRSRSANETPPAQIEFLEHCQTDFEFYCQNVLRIKTDFTEGKRADAAGTQIIPLIFSRAQRRFDTTVERLNRQGKAKWLLIAKGRRVGSSLYFLARLDHFIRTQRGKTAFIVSYDTRSSENLFSHIKTFYMHSDPAFQPTYRAFNRSEIHYENPDPNGKPGLDCRIFNSTCDNEDLGASFAIHFALFSEISRYESRGTNVRKIMTSLLPAVPRQPNTWVVCESTAEEGGEYFKTVWQSRNDQWERIFVSFVADEMCRIKREDFKEPQLSRSELSIYGNEEREYDAISNEVRLWYPELKAGEEIRHEAMNRILWRRERIDSEECHKDKEVFKVLYPSTEDDLFRASSESAFPVHIISSMEEQAKDIAPTRYTFSRSSFSSTMRDYSAAFHESFSGHLEIIEPPVEGERYAIGADPSHGISDRDPAAAVVLGYSPLRDVAIWNGSIRPDQFAYLLHALGCWFNRALLGVETYNVGTATQLKLTHELCYPNIYIRKQTDNRIVLDLTDQHGWATNGRSRDIMISDARAYVGEEEVQIRSKQTLAQMRTFQKQPNGKFEGNTGTHDDLVMALMIALQMIKSMPRIGAPQSDGPKDGTYDAYFADLKRYQRFRGKLV